MTIDFRLRPASDEMLSVFDNRIFNSRVSRGYEMKREATPDLVARMTSAGIDLGVVLGRDIRSTFGYHFSNQSVADTVAESDGHLIGFAGVDPNAGVDAVREIRRSVSELGLRGVSLDPYMHKIPADHRLYYPIYSTCVELDIPVVLTSGEAVKMPEVVIADAAPACIDRVATDFPELRIVASHGGYPHIMEMISVAHRHANVYFDISGMELAVGSDLYVKAANTVVGDKLLFGSAYPFVQLEESLRRYEQMDFDDAVRRQVMHENAERVLGLTTSATATVSEDAK